MQFVKHKINSRSKKSKLVHDISLGPICLLHGFDPFEDLTLLRCELGMPTISNNRSADGVLARLDIDEKSYYGINSWKSEDALSVQAYKQAGISPPFGPVTNHAEGDVILQAYKDGGKRNGGIGYLYIDHDCCGFCQTNLDSLRRKLGLNDLIVHERGRRPMNTKQGFAQKVNHIKINYP
jgi:hypothetical protein